jgi:hypothetical protein
MDPWYRGWKLPVSWADGGEDKKEPLFIYLISRIRGTTYLDFRLAHDWSSFEARRWRMNIMEDVARYV